MMNKFNEKIEDENIRLYSKVWKFKQKNISNYLIL